MSNIKSKSYTVRGKHGEWLAQIVLTSDGMFASVTDYGNLSFAWRNPGEDFRRFMATINVEYFGTKLFSGMSYILHDRKTEKACQKFAEMILPPLQELLKIELNQGIGWAEQEPCDGNCGMNYCDENGCTERKRVLTDPCPPDATYSA